jgi:hypothetical protein
VGATQSTHDFFICSGRFRGGFETMPKLIKNRGFETIRNHPKPWRNRFCCFIVNSLTWLVKSAFPDKSETVRNRFEQIEFPLPKPSPSAPLQGRRRFRWAGVAKGTGQ